MSGIVPEVTPRRPLSLSATIQVLHQQIDMSEEAGKLTVPLHKDLAYEVLRYLYELRDGSATEEP